MVQPGPRVLIWKVYFSPLHTHLDCWNTGLCFSVYIYIYQTHTRSLNFEENEKKVYLYFYSSFLFFWRSQSLMKGHGRSGFTDRVPTAGLSEVCVGHSCHAALIWKVPSSHSSTHFEITEWLGFMVGLVQHPCYSRFTYSKCERSLLGLYKVHQKNTVSHSSWLKNHLRWSCMCKAVLLNTSWTKPWKEGQHSTTAALPKLGN